MTEPFQLDDMFVPADPDALKDYSIEVIDEWVTTNGVGASIDVHYKGEFAFAFEVCPNGGCNTYYANDDNGKAQLQKFRDLARFLYPDRSEPEDLAVSWIEFRDI